MIEFLFRLLQKLVSPVMSALKWNIRGLGNVTWGHVRGGGRCFGTARD